MGVESFQVLDHAGVQLEEAVDDEEKMEEMQRAVTE
jgi:hypothetical protein